MEGRHNQTRRGQTPIVLAVVLVVRLVICWVEIQIRSYQRRNRTALADGARQRDVAERAGGMDGGNESNLRHANSTTTAISRANTRCSSMTVLYNRIAHSRDSPCT